MRYQQCQRRLPAEWEPQDAVLMAWPHPATDWATILAPAESTFAAIAAAITRFERLILLVPDETTGIRDQLSAAGADLSRVRMVALPTNDTWSRDFGPVTVIENRKPILLDFNFNGWGLKFGADLDNRITRELCTTGILTAPHTTIGLVLEGGSIESDGCGTILTTQECLLNTNRNPHLSREQLEQTLTPLLGANRFLWLEHGALAGDDTDSHIDTLARLCPNDTICHVTCDNPDDEHFIPLHAMTEELHRLRTRDDSPYRLVPLPLPAPIFDDAGERLPATHANFLIINGAVLVPTYNDPTDDTACAAIASVFPDRKIIGIDCRTLIQQHGSLHCVTMQLPQGVLR